MTPEGQAAAAQFMQQWGKLCDDIQGIHNDTLIIIMLLGVLVILLARKA